MLGYYLVSVNKAIIAPFDLNAVRWHRDRSAKKFNNFDFLFIEAVDRLLDRLDDFKSDFHVAAEFGCRTGELAGRLNGRGGIKILLQLDLSPGMAEMAQTRISQVKTPIRFVICALTEKIPLRTQSLDLVLTCLDLHWVNDLPGALLQIRKILRPDGLFLGSLFGGETLSALREVLRDAESEVTGGLRPRIAPFLDVRTAGTLLQRAGFALPVVDSDRVTVSYASALDLMRDLRGMGETNALVERCRTVSPRAIFLRAAALYTERYADSQGRILAEFDLITLTGRSPAPTQQQPVRPGSATASLAAALAATDGN